MYVAQYGSSSKLWRKPEVSRMGKILSRFRVRASFQADKLTRLDLMADPDSVPLLHLLSLGLNIVLKRLGCMQR